MQSILVTGGAGFIGSNFVRYLLENVRDINLVNLDALTYAGSMENLQDLPAPDRHTFVHGDICDRARVDEILHRHQIEGVVHFAAESHVDRSILGPAAFIQTNIVGTFTLLEAVRNYWDSQNILSPTQVRFHHISTDEVYGSLEPQESAFSETNPYRPNSPYAASKASSDHLVRAYAHTYKLPVTITNCSNNYGPYQFPEKLIPLMIFNAMAGRPLPVYGDGGQIRDWLYVEDHCRAIWEVIQRGVPGQIYNIGGDNQPTNLEIVRRLCAILDEAVPNSPNTPHEALIQFVPDRPGHDRRYAMDITKIRDELGWEPAYTLETGLEKTVKWYLDNADWVTAVMGSEEFRSWLEKNYDKRGN
jgi:dTDP-glucose 4,6-dehydratase